MAREIWLRPNRRALATGLVVPAGLALLAAGVLLAGGSHWGTWTVAGLLLALALLAAWAWRNLDQTPRLAYEDGQLLVYLTPWKPYQVPVDRVECFFAGRAPTGLPLPAGPPESVKTWSVVVRLAEAAQEWHERPVLAAWGEWKEGYITIRGTWCEPLDPEVLKKLNQRLSHAHRQAQDSSP
jgi:hypothetical protein